MHLKYYIYICVVHGISKGWVFPKITYNVPPLDISHPSMRHDLLAPLKISGVKGGDLYITVVRDFSESRLKDFRH